MTTDPKALAARLREVVKDTAFSLHHWDDGLICIHCGEPYDLACQNACLGVGGSHPRPKQMAQEPITAMKCGRCGESYNETPDGCRDPNCPLLRGF